MVFDVSPNVETAIPCAHVRAVRIAHKLFAVPGINGTIKMFVK